MHEAGRQGLGSAESCGEGESGGGAETFLFVVCLYRQQRRQQAELFRLGSVLRGLGGEADDSPPGCFMTGAEGKHAPCFMGAADTETHMHRVLPKYGLG